MVAIAIIFLVVWYVTQERIPKQIRVATGEKGGLYYQFANVFKPHLEKHTGSEVISLETAGTVENCRLLLSDNPQERAQIAIVQAGTCDMSRISAIAPLYHDVVHVIVRRASGIKTIQDLAGKKVILGRKGSGMRESSKQILTHYQVDIESLYDTEDYFLNLQEDECKADAAIVTTGMPNPDLGKLLITGKFDLIPILDGEALAVKHPYYCPINIPRGLFAPDVPAQNVPTIATTAFLAVRLDTPDLLVEKTLDALYIDYQPLEYPTVAPLSKVANWWTIPFHSAAIEYRDPYKGIDLLGKFLEWLADLKEILFAFAAVIYLTWCFWRKLKEKEEEAIVMEQKEQLDVMMQETMRIEEAHMETSDPKKLRAYLDEVTKIKLRSLKELTNEKLRGDRLFLIFLTQCANVIQKIQTKCIYHFEKNERQQTDSPKTPSPTEPSL